MSRLFRQAILCIIFGPVIGLFTAVSWFTIWPFIAAMEWLEEGKVHWRGIIRDSVGMWDEFITNVRTVR